MRSKKYCSRDCAFQYKQAENHSQWKGDKASYSAIHKWLYAHYEKPAKCEDCGSTKSIEWANISGSYNRERTDWKHLCKRCHMIYDGTDIVSNGGRWGRDTLTTQETQK